MLLGSLSPYSSLVSSFHPNQSFFFLLPSAQNHRIRTRRSNSFLHAVDKEAQFEIDREKAREALQDLDDQLQTLSQKQITPRERLLSSLDSKFEREMMRSGMMRKEMPEISGSYFAYSAVALLILTFVNNIIFNVFIKPAVDGEDPPPATIRREPFNRAVLQQQAPPPGDRS